MPPVITLSHSDPDRDLPRIIEEIRPYAAAIEQQQLERGTRAPVVFSHRNVTIPIASGSTTEDVMRRYSSQRHRLIAAEKSESHA